MFAIILESAVNEKTLAFPIPGSVSTNHSPEIIFLFEVIFEDIDLGSKR